MNAFKTLVSSAVLGAMVATSVGSPAAAADETYWPQPYVGASQFFRDVIAPRPMPPVPLRPNIPADMALDLGNYGPGRFVDHVRSVPLELGIIAGAIAVTGISSWHWGDSKFHFQKEGWFGKETHNGGMDKLGHAYSTYVIADLLTERMQANSDRPGGAPITAGLIAFGLMAGVEVADGFTKKYGFSREDLIADAVGALFAVARASVPGLRDKLDFRLMGTPRSYERAGVSYNNNFIIPPYRRQRYILALKGSGFEALKSTPARYLELQFGYDARGFYPEEMARGYRKERNLYAGLGLNMSELLFADGPVPNFARYRNTEPVWALEHVFRYIQFPYTAVYTQR